MALISDCRFAAAMALATTRPNNKREYLTRLGAFAVWEMRFIATYHQTGSNTAIQDLYNLAWKLALVIHGTATPALLDSYDAERIPVGKRVVGRATKSLTEYGAIFDALGITDATNPAQGAIRLEQLKVSTVQAAKRRETLKEAFAAKQYDSYYSS